MAHILAIDDDKAILTLIKNALQKDGHQITCVQKITKELENQLLCYDLILLDVMMPGIDGYTFCQNIRNQVDCPILFLTAKTMEEEVAFGFALGGDDYIKKPFSIVELRARIQAHLRRENREKSQCLSLSELHFYLAKKEVKVGQHTIPLTKSEYEISLLLAKNHGQVFSKEQIYEYVFGYEGESDASAITEHIKNIRKKLAAENIAPIETVWGIGYRWNGTEKKNTI